MQCAKSKIPNCRRYNKRMLTKGHSVPRDFTWIENYKLICQKKVDLNFSWPKNFVTLGKFCHLGPINILDQQKFELFHIEIKLVFKYDISSFWLTVTKYYSYLVNGRRKCNKNTCRIVISL